MVKLDQRALKVFRHNGGTLVLRTAARRTFHKIHNSDGVVRNPNKLTAGRTTVMRSCETDYLET